jgi:hypothetical protein
MNASSKQFDSLFKEIEHYKRFPALRPYVGQNYGKNSCKKLMLIAESHYLPQTSTINKDADKWYKATQADLNPVELSWMNTRSLLKGDWADDGQMIYRELNLRLSEFINTSASRAMTNVVFMNGFQRPAPNTGDSIKKFCTEQDYEVGAKTIKQVVSIVEPDLVLFVSKLAWDKLRWKLPKEINGKKYKYDFVCHPGTGGKHWHRKTYDHGVRKFQRLVKELYTISDNPKI